jgi:signal transduction histidine kinase
MVTSLAPWTVQVHVDDLLFYTPHLQVAGYLLAGLLFMGVGTTLVARRGSRRLVAAMHLLADGATVGPAVSAAELRIAEIESVRAQMQQLRVARASAQERERKRIARDLHDGMQQGLAAAQIDIDLARARVKGIDLPATELLNRVRGNVEGLIGELDNIVRELRPAALEHLGLKAAIEQQIDRLCRMSRLQIELEVVGEEAACSSLSPTVSECAYRVLQECLNNVHKHAGASFVYVVLDVSKPHRIVLQVSDDGCGLPDARTVSQGESFGLTGIRERVSALGGWVHLMSARDGASEFSTTVLVALPLRGAPES